jgi:hypothetical protein
MLMLKGDGVSDGNPVIGVNTPVESMLKADIDPLLLIPLPVPELATYKNLPAGSIATTTPPAALTPTA